MLPLCTLAESIAQGIAFTDGKRFDVAGKIYTKARSGANDEARGCGQGSCFEGGDFFED